MVMPKQRLHKLLLRIVKYSRIITKNIISSKAALLDLADQFDSSLSSNSSLITGCISIQKLSNNQDLF